METLMAVMLAISIVVLYSAIAVGFVFFLYLINFIINKGTKESKGFTYFPFF